VLFRSRKLPVDFLKIDGALVSGLGSDGLNRTLVSAVAQIGREMGIAVIAERVDDSGVGEALQQLGIVYGQGYLFDHPVGGTPATA
jgi:EAL domain-containing protein (putative c-di-GMP-specific phosphodiesterase class I)